MPIRIWNQPGGPVQWGEDWGFKEKPMDMSEEEWQAYLAERQVGETPSGRLAGYGGGTLDMTGGNLAAKERILSRGSPFEGLSRQQYGDVQTLADQGLSPDEMTAMRLSRPRFQTETLQIGEDGPSYDISQMVEPSREDLSRSAEYWKMAGQPLEMRAGEEEIGKIAGEAAKEAGLGELYSAQAGSYGADKSVEFEDFVAKIAPALKGMDAEEARKMVIAMWEFKTTGKWPANIPGTDEGGGAYPGETSPPGFFRRLFGGGTKPEVMPDEEGDLRYRR